jgi:hypothetical protein
MVLVPSGPLILAIILANWASLSEPVAQLVVMLATVWFLCSLVLVPALLFREEPSPGSSADEDGGGSGGPPKSPSRDPDPGGIPLPDAEQSSERVRDHVRRRRRSLRRTAREPDPARSPKRSTKLCAGAGRVSRRRR